MELAPFTCAHATVFLSDRLALKHAPHTVESLARERCAAHAVILERLIRGRHPIRDDLANFVRIDTNFVLRVAIGPQTQEVEQVVKIHLPIPLGIDVRRFIRANSRASPCWPS